MKRKITTIDQFGLHVYGPNKDGRIRAWDPETGRVCQYCRLLMEKILGRRLERGEDVHHIDEDPNNNDPSNLEIIDHSTHASNHNKEKINKGEWKNESSFKDKEMICPMCKKIFIWSAHSQYENYRNRNRKNRINKETEGPFCSKECCGKRNQNIQMLKKFRDLKSGIIQMRDINDHNILIKEFKNLKEASEYTGIGKSSICRYLNGKQNCKLYYWCYA